MHQFFLKNKIIIFLGIILSILFLPKISWAVDYYDWSVRTDRNSKPAGIFTTTPFPITEADTTYSIINDEGTKVYTLGNIYFVDNGATGCINGSTTYDPSTRTCGSGSYIIYTNLTNAFNGTTDGNKTILVRAGTYTQTWLTPRIGIDDTHRYYVIGYNQERPVIDGGNTDALIFNGFAGAAAEAYGTLQRLEIRNSNQECMQAGSYSSEIDGNVNYIDLDIHDCCLAEVGCNANIILVNQDDAWLYHNDVHRAGNHGIKVAENTDRILVEWNHIYEVGWWAGDSTDRCGTHCIALDIVAHEASGYYGLNNVARYNIINNTYSYALNVEHQDIPIIHHNEIYNAFRVYDINPTAATWVGNRTTGAYSVNISESPKGSFYGNVIRDKRGSWESLNDHGHLQFWASTALIPAGIWEVFNNLFYDGEVANAVEHVIQTSANFQTDSTVNIYNNTIYADTAGGDDALIAKSSWDGIMNIKNNILYQVGVGKVISGSPVVDYNLYYYPSGTLGITPGANDINNVNPLFIQTPSGTYDINDGNLQSISPVINAGISLISNFTNSFLNIDISRPQGLVWDIGAYEYVEAAPPPDTIPPAPPTNLQIQ